MYLSFFYPYRQRHMCSPLPTDRIGRERKVIPDEYAATFGIYERVYSISECPVCGKEYPYNLKQFTRIDTIDYREYKLIKELE